MTRRDPYTHNETKYEKAKVRWRGNVIHDMIRNSIYKGKRKWKNKYYDVPAIIDVDTWERANKNLQKNKKKAGRREEYSYLLNGIVFCSDCGREFRGKKRLKGNDLAYKCKGKIYPNPPCKESRGISIPKLETFIIKHLFENKQLQEQLLNHPKTSTENNLLKEKLEKLQKQLTAAKRKEDRAYSRLNDDEDDRFKDDQRTKDDYFNAQSEQLKIAESIEVIENRIIELESESSKKRMKKLFGDYDVSVDFKTLKRLIHSLVRRIEIKHYKAEKGGYFIIRIYYRGVDEYNDFMTKWQAMSWLHLRRYRSKAITDKDLFDDKELMEHLGGNPDEAFEGFESVGIANQEMHVNLKKDELISFD